MGAASGTRRRWSATNLWLTPIGVSWGVTVGGALRRVTSVLGPRTWHPLGADVTVIMQRQAVHQSDVGLVAPFSDVIEAIHFIDTCCGSLTWVQWRRFYNVCEAIHSLGTDLWKAAGAGRLHCGWCPCELA